MDLYSNRRNNENAVENKKAKLRKEDGKGRQGYINLYLTVNET